MLRCQKGGLPMTNAQYFPHDATAGSDVKLMTLIGKEGVRGYGIYWYLVEFLRQQQDYRGRLSLLPALAQRLRTKSTVIKRVVEEYALFRVEGDYFYSPGLIKRMQPLEYKRSQLKKESTPEIPPTCTDSDADILQPFSNHSAAEMENGRRTENSNSLKSSNLTSLVDIEEKSKEEKSKEKKKEERRKEASEGRVFAVPDYAHNTETHNYDGLCYALNMRGITDPKEVQTILALSDFGRMGGQVWKVLYYTRWKDIRKPGLFLISELRKYHSSA